MQKRKLFSFLFFFYLSLFSINSFSQDNEQKEMIKFDLEERLEKRVNDYLEKYGFTGISVQINIELDQEYKVTPNKLYETAGMGIFAGKTKTMIKNMDVKIIVKGIILSESEKNDIKNIVSAMLDTGNIKFIQGYTEKTTGFNFSKLIYPPDIYWIVIIILSFMFMIGLFINFSSVSKKLALSISEGLNNLSKTKTSQSEIESTNSLTNPGSFVQEQFVDESFVSEKQADMEEKPFGFIKETDLKKIKYLIKDYTAAEISIIVNFINPEWSKSIYDDLPKETKNQIIGNLSKVKVADSSKVINLEKDLKEKLKYLVFSEDFFENILEKSDEQDKKQIIDNLSKTNTEMATKLLKNIITFSDVIRLDSISLQLVIRQVGITNFARMIKNLDSDIKQKLFANLNQRTKDRLNEEIAIVKPLSAKKLEQEKVMLFKLIKKLLEDEIIKYA